MPKNINILGLKIYTSKQLYIIINMEPPKYLLGKNAADNWKIYKESSQADTVFHLDKFSSPYVIVNLPIAELTPEHINTAAELCKSKSKYKNMSNIGVMYTPISNTILGDALGSFIISSNHKVKVIYI